MFLVVSMPSSKDNLWDPIQMTRLGDKCLYPLNHLTSPVATFWKKG